ncbi:MAG: hypothetical protein WC374_01685 [Phycisphaerae bacterium]|jgi:hypothetical protein
MLILLFYLFIGFVVSLLLHICALTKIAYHPNWLVNTLGIGINVVVIVVFLIGGKIKRATGEKELIWITLKNCPRWLKLITGLIMLYGTVVFGLSFIWLVLHSETMDEQVGIHIASTALTALMLLFYAAFFTMLYCYRKIYKKCARDNASQLEEKNIFSFNNKTAL